MLEGKTPAERRKVIVAVVLGAVALLSLAYMFFGSSSSGPARTTAARRTSPAARQPPPDLNGPTRPDVVRQETETQVPLQPVVFNWAEPSVPEARRNIFAYYTAPPVAPKTSPGVQPTAPLPTPPLPSLILASVSPTNVFSRTGDFMLQISGDKFTPATRIYIDNSELPTSFVNAQQLSANVPAAMIGAEGPRQIVVRTPDGALFSNAATLNVQAPPAPNYTYVGIIAPKRGGNETAVLADKGSKEILNVQRGDVVGGRFRVSSISEREIVLNDTSLRIKHALPFTGDASAPGSSNRGFGSAPGFGSTPGFQPPPQPRRDSDDDDEGTP